MVQLLTMDRLVLTQNAQTVNKVYFKLFLPAYFIISSAIIVLCFIFLDYWSGFIVALGCFFVWSAVAIVRHIYIGKNSRTERIVDPGLHGQFGITTVSPMNGGNVFYIPNSAPVFHPTSRTPTFHQPDHFFAQSVLPHHVDYKVPSGQLQHSVNLPSYNQAQPYPPPYSQSGGMPEPYPQGSAMPEPYPQGSALPEPYPQGGAMPPPYPQGGDMLQSYPISNAMSPPYLPAKGSPQSNLPLNADKQT